MDFETTPITRDNIRYFANLIRKNYKIRTIKFPVLKFLEKIEEYTNDAVSYLVEDDMCFESGVMAYIECSEDFTNYCIHIRESVYVKAYQDSHADIGYIMHEICHYFMIGVLGCRPNMSICCTTNKIPAYKSAEWQAMALCGELMIPYERCKNKTLNQICSVTGSSRAQARYFLEHVLK